MKPAAVLERLEAAIGLDGGPVSIRIAIERVLTDNFELPPIQAAERAEAIARRVSKLVEWKQNTHKQNGTVSTLCLLGSSQDIIAGSCYVLPGDDVNIINAKRSRLHVESLFAAIRELTFNNFEKFGAKVLKELGAQKVRVTPQSNDQGIDFYGVMNIGELQQAPAAFFKLAHDVEVRFAGQAKHYPNRTVGPSSVRELVGAISLARYNTFSSKTSDLFEDFGLKPFNPLVALLFSTGEITAGARSLADGAGIIIKSGAQIAVFLADRGVGMTTDANGVTSFDQEKFDSWLSL